MEDENVALVLQLGAEMQRVSHDLNNVLAVVLNGSQFALEELGPKGEALVEGNMEPELIKMIVESLEDVLAAGRRGRTLSVELNTLGRQHSK